MTTAEREFEVMQRGEIRDLVLNHFRSGLRQLTNPETGELFTEDEIAQATGPGSRWWREATAVDDYGQGKQRTALFLNDQAQMDRASTAWLERYHARLWDPDGRLAATGGSGQVLVTGTPGTPINHSTTVPDNSACWGRSPEGYRFQVYAVSTSDGAIASSGSGAGTVSVTLVAMDPGIETNLAPDTVITWAYRNDGMAPQAAVTSQFVGGTDTETDAEWAARMESNARYKQGGGNDAQQRAWARRVSNSIEDAFIYPCAHGTNSFQVCLTQKRGNNLDPEARLASAVIREQATAFLTPPGSPVEPSDPFVLVTTPQADAIALGLRLTMPVGSETGWEDTTPWPQIPQGSGNAWPSVASVTSTTAVIGCPDEDNLPGLDALSTATGEDVPAMMGWDEDEMRFRSFAEGAITDVEDLGSHMFRVTWAVSRPSWVQSGMPVSPLSRMHPEMSAAIVEYFDELGPGELYEVSHEYFDRCRRFPDSSYERPSRLGSDIATRVQESLGGACSSAILAVPANGATPTIPTDPADGPFMLVPSIWVAVMPLS